MRDVHWESLVDPRTRAVWAKVGWTAFCFAFAGALLSMHGSPHAEVRLTLPQWAIFPGPYWVSLGAMFGSLALDFVDCNSVVDDSYLREDSSRLRPYGGDPLFLWILPRPELATRTADSRIFAVPSVPATGASQGSLSHRFRDPFCCNWVAAPLRR